MLQLLTTLLTHILRVQLTNSQLGRTVCYTTSVILAVLLIAPIYDLVALHKYKVS